MSKKTHGMSETRFYNIWSCMRRRCINKKRSDYQYYGGRGIKVSNEWNNFETFLNDMYESYLRHVSIYGEKNTSLDRINTDGNYEFDNCRWATHREQMNNRRKLKPRKQKETKIAKVKKLKPRKLRKTIKFKGVSPTGEISVGFNLAEFARIHNLERSCIGRSLKNGTKHKGWTFEYLED
jgi:hypothetical protein